MFLSNKLEQCSLAYLLLTGSHQTCQIVFSLSSLASSCLALKLQGSIMGPRLLFTIYVSQIASIGYCHNSTLSSMVLYHIQLLNYNESKTHLLVLFFIQIGLLTHSNTQLHQLHWLPVHVFTVERDSN